MRPILLPALWLAAAGLASAKPKIAVAPRLVTDITAEAKPSIVTVTQIGRGGGQEALGTGFVVSKDGLIATNLHVIGNARRLQVQLSDGTMQDVTEIHATDSTLDLAVIRIAKKDLKPIAIGDSDKIAQGEQVVAIGHPQGLDFSVVEGVISAIRPVDESLISGMIQIAIPIEQGNSGGPLLDMQGRVQGILTLKSAITDNLGFAHPINQLKLLLQRPNPIPMSRWLTIGRLDPKRWEPLMGARWTQHAGIIHVDDAGDGFGGRSLCLSQSETPGEPFEASVTVKLDDEGGAAGLAFCSDGHDQHYGFYPSGGNLRLTRFNGPDVFSWTILSDAPCAAYKAGNWNTLRVHVDKSKIQCFVNDTLATEVEDTELRGGRAGLCKFRQTRAQFKSFRVGEDLSQKAIPAQLAAELEGQLKQYLEKPAQHDATMEKLLTEPVAARSLLEQRAKSLEDQAASLRKLGRDMHRQAISREIVRLMQRPADQAELLRAALLVAKHDNADLDIDSYLQTVQHMVEELKNDPDITSGSTSRAAGRLITYLFQECGFHGSRNDSMDDFANSYMNEVLDDREGIPLTLSIVFLELARKLGLKDIYGVGLPGRFMVAYSETIKGEANRKFVDVFEGGKVRSEGEVFRFVEEMTGRGIDSDQLEPATPRAMILRLLHNLTQFSKKPEQALPYQDLIVNLEPQSSQERLQRALMRMKTGDVHGTKEDLETLMAQKPDDLDMDKVQLLYRSL
jgi:regulator of sirC expression with transglutaminase-like and TPR domain